MASAAPAAVAAPAPSAAPAGGGASPTPGAPASGGGEAFDPVADVHDLFENEATFEHPDVDDAPAEGAALAAQALEQAKAGPAAADAEEAPAEEAAPIDGLEPEQPVAEKFKIVDGLEFDTPEQAAEAFRRQSGRAKAEAERAQAAIEAGRGWVDTASALAEEVKRLGGDPRAVLQGQPAALRPGQAGATQPQAQPQADGDAQPFDFNKTATEVYGEKWFKESSDSLLQAMSAGDDASARQAVADTLSRLAQSNADLTKRAMEAIRAEMSQRLQPFEQQVQQQQEDQQFVDTNMSLIKQVSGARDDAGALMFADLFEETPQGMRFKGGPTGEAAKTVRFITEEMRNSNWDPTPVNFGKAYALYRGLELLDGKGASNPAATRRAAGGDPTISGTGMSPLAVPRRGNSPDRDGMPAKAPRSVMGVRQRAG